jgi:uncharacterized protein YndB with AHSA1/START domain
MGKRLLLLALLCCGGCGQSITRLNQLAAVGSIDEEAAVKAHLQIHIRASPAKVWALLNDASSWPRWQPDIESVSVAVPLAEGTRFSWKTGGLHIHSQVQLYDPVRSLGWTGTAMSINAVHIWQLQNEDPGGTLVMMKESMEGPALAVIPSAAQKLAESDQRWLEALK